MTKKMALITVIGVGLLITAVAYAESQEGHQRMGKHGGGFKQGESGQCQVAGKFTKKTHFILKNKAELGLTAEQVQTINDLKLQAEKDSAHQNADREIFKLDLKSKLGADKIDVEGTNALIDKGYASMAESTKSDVAAYAKLKNVLTPDQVKKMKELLENKKQMWENKGK